MLPKSYCQALTATRQPTDSQTDSPRGQRRRGNIESNSIDVDAALWAGGGGTVVRRLVQHFSITSLCNVFCSHFSSLSLFSSHSLIFYLCCRYNAASFLSFPFLSGRSSWRNQTHYVQSVEALSMILLYSAPSLLLLLLLSLAFRFLRICQLGVMKDIERALGIRLARDVDL